MARAIKCDRCGELYEKEIKHFPYPKIKVFDEQYQLENQRAYLEVETLDLCVECQKSFIRWLKGEIQ